MAYNQLKLDSNRAIALFDFHFSAQKLGIAYHILNDKSAGSFIDNRDVERLNILQTCSFGKQTVTEEMPLKVKIRLVPDDILHAIEGEIGLTSNL